MLKSIYVIFAIFLTLVQTCSAKDIDEIIPIRGFAIEAPRHRTVDLFLRFINEDLANSRVNLLILRVDWDYTYKSHPELSIDDALTKDDVEKIVKACKKNGIRLVPHINLLGHQSVKGRALALLSNYPQFDETPSLIVEEQNKWPAEIKNYSKSYCPLHPDVHNIIFDIVDELCDVFQSDAFHAGMDEVLFIGEDECPRCQGKDKSELFANEVKMIHDHLALKGRNLMIWGDRLLDGRATGLGPWEASYNDTWRAIDMIPNDVTIFDWHYERADLTAIYFAIKGFPVVSCGYKDSVVSVKQIEDMIRFRSQTTPATAKKLQGYVHTIWNSSEYFLANYYNEPFENFKVEKKYENIVSTAKAVLKYFREINDMSLIIEQ